jgi:hypothetical protein
MITQFAIHKQFLINNLDKNLPKELCEIIKSYCFYDSKTYQILCNTCRFKIDICDIINEHVINNEQLFIDNFIDYDDNEDNIIENDYTTIIYTIQQYIPELNTFKFTINNIIDLCLLCGNYISCKTNIPNKIRCNCLLYP